MESKQGNKFPQRAYIQKFDNVPPDYIVVVDELKKRGIPVICKCTEDIVADSWNLTRDDLVVGNFDWTQRALTHLRISMPKPPDYPACLASFASPCLAINAW